MKKKKWIIAVICVVYVLALAAQIIFVAPYKRTETRISATNVPHVQATEYGNKLIFDIGYLTKNYSTYNLRITENIDFVRFSIRIIITTAAAALLIFLVLRKSGNEKAAPAVQKSDELKMILSELELLKKQNAQMQSTLSKILKNTDYKTTDYAQQSSIFKDM
jgi:flagellar basal body-associated protein FliL